MWISKQELDKIKQRLAMLEFNNNYITGQQNSYHNNYWDLMEYLGLTYTHTTATSKITKKVGGKKK